MQRLYGEMSRTITHLGQNVCPCCNHPVDRGTSMNTDQKMTPGSVGICWYCENVLFFETDMALRELSIKEFFEMPQDAQRIIYNIFNQVKKSK